MLLSCPVTCPWLPAYHIHSPFSTFPHPLCAPSGCMACIGLLGVGDPVTAPPTPQNSSLHLPLLKSSYTGRHSILSILREGPILALPISNRAARLLPCDAIVAALSIMANVGLFDAGCAQARRTYFVRSRVVTSHASRVGGYNRITSPA